MSMKNPIREKLDRGGLLLCMMLRQSDMAAAEIAAQYGIDMLCIDNEHYPFNPQRVEALARAAQIYGSGVVIRVPNEEAARVAQMMDCQLQGIKIPHVETKEQALAIVNAVKYAPVGTRGFCPITRAADYGFTASPADYPVRANRDSVVSIMVETKWGLENLDEILSIPEIDVVAIGPSDVSASYGLPGQPDHPVVKAAIEEGQRKIIASGKCLCDLYKNPEQAKKAIRSGVRMFQIGSPLQLLSGGFKELIQGVKARM